MTQKIAFALSVLPDICAFHRYTRNSIFPCLTLEKQYRMLDIGWAYEFNTRLTIPPTCPLRLVIPDNACLPRITAAAGTELAEAYS